jgi:putative endonuclease
MGKQKQRLGRWGEDAAARYLTERGYKVIARNVRTEFGEIDLIAKQGDQLVFVEVKARSGSQFGQPEEAVTQTKQEHLVNAAESYLQTNPHAEDWRVDVLAIRRNASGKLEIVHFENAING